MSWPTAAELIERLQQYPPDFVVLAEDGIDVVSREEAKQREDHKETEAFLALLSAHDEEKEVK